MFENLTLFRLSGAMARHAGMRQAVVAQNMANADTPGFRARDIPAFRDLVDSGGSGFAPRATRDAHLHGQRDMARLTPSPDENAVANPDGNTVTLEQEMLRGVEAKRQHDRALAIYKSSLTLLRASLGR